MGRVRQVFLRCAAFSRWEHDAAASAFHGRLIPLFAVEIIEPELLERLPGFKRRLEWFMKYRALPIFMATA